MITTIGNDFELYGKYGFIWQVADNEYAAMIINKKIAKKYAPMDEALGDTKVTFPGSELALWIKRLEVSQTSTGAFALGEWWE